MGNINAYFICPFHWHDLLRLLAEFNSLKRNQSGFDTFRGRVTDSSRSKLWTIWKQLTDLIFKLLSPKKLPVCGFGVRNRGNTP